jgi:hypothetical protein
MKGTNDREPVGVIEVLKMQEKRDVLEEIARNFKKNGISLDIIAKSTKLPLKVIKAL